MLELQHLPGWVPTPIVNQTSPDAPPRRAFAGGAGTLISGGFIHDMDRNPEVHREKWYGDATTLGKANEMMRDSHVRTAVNGVVSTLKRAQWDFRPAGPSDLDKEVADSCRWAFMECNAWSFFIERLARGYIRDGFQLFELTDDVREISTTRFPNHPGNGLAIVPTGFHQRQSRTLYNWKQSKQDPTKLEGIVQFIVGSDGEPARFQDIPADRLLRATWEQEGADFSGLAPLRSAWGPFKVKRMLQTIQAMAFERHGLGTPTITLGEESQEDEREEIERILAELRAHEKGFVILPHGYQFEWSTVRGAQSTNIGEAIKAADFDIAHCFSAGFMLLGNKSASGSYALASTLQGQYEIALDAHARFIEDVFNIGMDGYAPAERFVRQNWGPGVPVPRLVARQMPTRDWSKILPIADRLTMSGHITPDDTTEAFMRDAMFLPQHDPTTAREPRIAGQPLATSSSTEPEGETDDVE